MRSKALVFIAAMSLGMGCAGGTPNDIRDMGPAGPVDPGTAVTPGEPASLADERKAVAALLADTAHLTPEELAARYAPSFASTPTYTPENVAGLDKIQASTMALNDAELSDLAGRGFVITDRSKFPTFVYGYHSAYLQHLPVYVSADSILFALHRSYDAILAGIEQTALMAELGALLDGMRGKLASGALAGFSSEAQKDADFYLAVARSLLSGKPEAPVANGDAASVGDIFQKATAAAGVEDLTLFGYRRAYDFSQFEPRGHYTDFPDLSRYFRAMMWLGRTDFRLIETNSDGTQTYLRRQLEGALALHDLIDAELLPRYRRIDAVVSAFVGEHDYMTVEQFDKLISDLSADSSGAVMMLPDAKVADAIVAGRYGTQRIASHVMINGMNGGTLPLASSFALLGQRYVLDSHVFSNVVYDRVQGGSVMRMMPNPLDVAFSVLENGQAAVLLRPQLESFHYSPDLGAMRVLADAHPPEFWQGSLYNLWLGTLRALSPRPAADGAPNAALPPVTRSEAWGRRLLNTELASWAELRHDTILYAKQSYTGGASCDFPDAFVDPYPEFFSSVARYAEFGKAMLVDLNLGTVTAQASAHFDQLADVAHRLQSMAEYELTGAAFTADMLAFINDAVVVQTGGCGGPSARGWYARLFYGSPVEADPTIADVHTQPTDETGAPVGKVLHVGTGYAREMVVVAEGCSGPRAYVGPVSSYFERVTTNFERLNDPGWATEIVSSPPPSDVSWMSDLVAR